MNPDEILEETGGNDDADDEPEHETFEYAVEAHEDDVEYFLEGVDGVDFTPHEESKRIYVSDDGTRVAGRLMDGERHAFDGLLVEESTMLDADVRGDGTAFIDGGESALGWYPRPDAAGDDWKDLDELLDLEGDEPEEDEPDDDESKDDENGDDDADEELRKAIVIDGTDADGPSSYSFEVSGTVEPSTYRGATIDDDTVVDGGAVEGTVDGTKDAYRFNGDITGFWISGDATVDLEYGAR